MLALLTIFEHLSSVRRLLNRFSNFYSPYKEKPTEIILNDDEAEEQQQQQQHILLRPIVKSILSDGRLKYFDNDFHDDLHTDDYLASELDACLLEIRELERDLNKFKQRQCTFYESYLDFIDEKDQLIEKFIEYYDEYLPSKHPKTHYEFNIPVSNRFELLKRQHT